MLHMTRTIILLSPVFVSIFWAITLFGDKKTLSIPRLFLSKFMILPLICFITHFLYFSHLSAMYPYFDFPYQYAGSLILPVFYIYFRILTIDKKFSWTAHARYLAIPFSLATVYCIGAVLTPQNEYKTWLFDERAFPFSTSIQFLNFMRKVLRIQFLILVILTVIGNFRLISRFGVRADQFYHQQNDGLFRKTKILNYSFIIACCASIIAVALGRRLLMPKDYIIYIVWSISTVMLYIIGYTGYKQKTLNPAHELGLLEVEQQSIGFALIGAQKKILEKVNLLFDEKKIYLNSELNIMNIVSMVGTNRTYISTIINQQYNQNFCAFVNGYRIEELKRLLIENSEYSNEILSEKCGFGSVISLKRSVLAKTGLSMTALRNQQLLSSQNNE